MLNEKIKEAINKCISDIAEDYYGTTPYDEDMECYVTISWKDSIWHAIDDFREDVAGYMECYDYEDLTQEEIEEISDYAWNSVNTETIRKYA